MPTIKRKRRESRTTGLTDQQFDVLVYGWSCDAAGFLRRKLHLLSNSPSSILTFEPDAQAHHEGAFANDGGALA